jgi:hypothetical protein
MVDVQIEVSPTVADDDVLDLAFPKGVPTRERELWERLTVKQREKASRRLGAIVGWNGGFGQLTADAATKAAGLSLSRFYRLAAEWRHAPSLSVLGTFAVPLSRRSKFEPDVINALQAKVAAVVSQNDGVSVSGLVDLLIDVAAVPRDRLPGSTKLREIVQAELRRLAATHDAGTAIVIDVVAVSLSRSDGRPHVMFVCIDVGTRAILGVALGDVAQSVAGYGAAAADALRTISEDALRLPWGRRLANAVLTAGLDVDECRVLVDRLGRGVSDANVLLSTRSNRFGRKVRSLVGPRFGRVSITPTRTAEGDAMVQDATPWSEVDALAELRAAAAAHNATLTPPGMDAGEATEAPQSLLQMLRELAGA